MGSLIWLALLGCSEVGITDISQPPEITLIRPSDGLFDPDFPVEVCAQVDFDFAVSNLTTELRSDVDGVLATDGFTECEGGNMGLTVTLSDTTHVLTMTVTDAQDRADTATVTIEPTPNVPPTCVIQSPIPGTTYEDGTIVSMTVQADDPDGDALTVAVASDVDGALDTAALAAPSSIGFDVSLSAGDHELVVTVTDAFGAFSTCTTTVTLDACGDDDADGFDACDGDCDDTAPHTHPGAPELPDGQDNDCDGLVDEGTALGDDDGDGFHELAGDCDDTNASIFPGAVDVPDDGIDQDCSGADTVTCYEDGDGDGYGSTTVVLADDGDCDDAGEAPTDDDCDDTDAGRNPGAAEIPADGIDQDCDGVDPAGCYQDNDGDGFGTSIELPAGDGDCDDPGESPYQTDCDDGDATIYPGADELIDDGEDQDCNGADTIECFEDLDLDGFGSEEVVFAEDGSCDTGDNESTNDGDCDDAEAGIRPGVVDPPGDGVDQDCDGTDAVTCFVDDDLDGFGTNATITVTDGDCDDPGEADVNGDCSDANPEIYPGRPEIPDDFIDQDCNGADTVTCFEDQDRDGFGTSATLPAPDGTCDTDDQESDVDGDCDDEDASRHPGADDSNTTDGIDANCDGVDGYPGADADGDGHEAPADCDDNDPSVNPDADETRDGLDNDCDGRCDEGLLAAGDLVISEVMVQPEGPEANPISDNDGEWFEIHNPTGTVIRLCDGWTFEDDGIDQHFVTEVLEIPAGGYIVAGTNSTLNLNGGVTADYLYDRNELPLGNAPDELSLVFDGLVVDHITWDNTSFTAGASMQLDRGELDATSNDTLANWCDSTSPWPGSLADAGSPGEPNASCP